VKGQKLIWIAVFAVIESSQIVCEAGMRDTTILAFWNLENFFDYRNDSTSTADAEFSSFGDRHWTKKKFYCKCNAIAKALLWMGGKYGRMPDAVGFAEVENRFVLERLVYGTGLKKYGYKIVHYESPDPRGIDVALLYREAVFRCDTSLCLKVTNPDNNGPELRTRDILAVKLTRIGKSAEVCEKELAKAAEGKTDGLTVFVNHHPSKYGGEQSAWRRVAAMHRLEGAADSLSHYWVLPQVAMGDFNDTPDNPLYRENLGLIFANESLPLFEKKAGTIRYRGKWELIDMFFVTPYLAETSEMEIVSIPFLTVRDNTYAGEKPMRTYSGPRYVGGVSDHCPIVLKIVYL